jgi:hypothetical protein
MFTIQIAYKCKAGKVYELSAWRRAYTIEVQPITKHQLPWAEHLDGERLDGTVDS